MPRRGEHTTGFPAPGPRISSVQRIGPRQVTARDRIGQVSVLTFDPSKFECTRLAGELADEWVELAAATGFVADHMSNYRRSITEFCEHVEASVARSRTASLTATDPDLHRAVTEWIRLLPSRYPAGSRIPAQRAGQVRALIARRIAHPGRPVAGLLHQWVGGSLGLRRGETEELDEFTRAEKKALVLAAWADRLAIEARISRGWAWAAAGTDPVDGGWAQPANLLWAISRGKWSCQQIAARLPAWRHMPTSLRRLLPEDTDPSSGKRLLIAFLLAQVYPHNIDLHSYRILLMAATGRAPEEVTGLVEDDIEYGQDHAVFDFTKNRARTRTRQSYGTVFPEPDAVLHPARPRLDAAETTRGLLELVRPLAQRAGLSPVPLFLRAGLVGYRLDIKPFRGTAVGTQFPDWLARHDVAITDPVDIRRLRKSGKVEKAIAFKGRISDIADDHSTQTFRGHYAHGTTLRVIAGDVIATAQQRWLDQALDGPVVLDAHSERLLGEPGAGAALGLSAQDVELLRTGQLDMGLSSCKDPFDSPYAHPGKLCPVAPTRCLECRNAFVLPSNLPQLLLFAAHLDKLSQRLTPHHFHALWGQSRVNVNDALAARSASEIALARSQITTQGLTLQLPLAAHVEFDS